jgi:hypothetical protein
MPGFRQPQGAGVLTVAIFLLFGAWPIAHLPSLVPTSDGDIDLRPWLTLPAKG